MDFKRIKRNIRHKLIWKLGGIPEDMPVKLPTAEIAPWNIQTIKARVTKRGLFDTIVPEETLGHMIVKRLIEEGYINVRVVDDMYQYECITYEAELRVVMGGLEEVD